MLATFLCANVPSAPPNVPALDPIAPGVSVQQALASSTGNALCQTCHQVVDPVGLAFERFDDIGRVRVTDNGVRVDTSDLKLVPVYFGMQLPDAVIDGPVDLAKAISVASGAEACIAQQWLSFALGRDVTAADATSLNEIQGAFSTSGFNLKELIVATLTSAAFLAPPQD